MIESSLYSVLSGASAVSAIVATRIYPLVRPQADPLPAIVYQRVSTTPVNSLAGDSGVDAVRVQVSCMASTYTQAKSLAEAARNAIRGGLKAITEMEMDDYDDETSTYRVLLDFRIWQL